MLRKFLLTAILAVSAGIAVPTTCRADFTLTLSVGSHTETFYSNPTIGQNGFSTFQNQFGTSTYGESTTFQGYAITFSGSTNSPGGDNAILTNNSITVSGGGSTPLVMTIVSTGYQSPTGPGTLITDLGASILPTGTLVASSAIVGVGTTPDATLTPSNYKNGAETSVEVTLPSSYAVSNTITVSGLTYGKQDSFTLTSTVVAPAPPGLVMLVGAVPFFGCLRRRLGKAGPSNVA
jgi:hypothetical protein